jgi:cytoskeletal protein RodZ
MTKSGFSFLKLTAVVAVLALAIIGLAGLLSRTTVAREKSTTTPRELASTPEEKSLERAATVPATEGDSTTPTLPPTEGCDFDGVKVTAVNVIEGTLEDKIEVGWNFTPPQALAGLCLSVDDFYVNVHVTYVDGKIAARNNTVSALTRNEVARFSSIGRKIKSVEAFVRADYKMAQNDSDKLKKDF